MPTQIQLRRDTAANWASANPQLAPGEPGLETDTRRLKHGNGQDNWNDLPYADGEFVNAPEFRSAYVLPGVAVASISTFSTVANSIHYAPHFIVRAGTLTELHAEVTTAATTGLRAKILLYEMDANWTPGALRAESGHLAVDVLGKVSLTGLSIPIERGDLFLAALWVEGTTVFRGYRGYFQSSAIDTSLSATSLLNSLRAASSTYGGVAPTPGPTVTHVGYTANPLTWAVAWKID